MPKKANPTSEAGGVHPLKNMNPDTITTESNETINEVPVGTLPATGTPDTDNRPWVELPRDGRLTIDFARALGACMRSAFIFLQDGVPVIVRGQKVEQIDADGLRVILEKFVRPFKWSKGTKKADDPPPYEILSTMSKGTASCLLRSPEFLDSLRPLRILSTIPLPIFRDGALVLQGVGYDAATQLIVIEP